MDPDKLEKRYAALEYRADDNGGLGTVSGVLMKYGDVADIGWFTEEFKANAFEMYPRGVYANRMHQRSQPLAKLGRTLQFTDSNEEMRVEFPLPDTTAGRDTDYEVREGLLAGLSVEFRVIKESYDSEKNHAVIERAMLYGFGVVDIPAYPSSKSDIRSHAEYRSHFGLYLPGGERAPKAEPVEEPEPARRRYFMPVV